MIGGGSTLSASMTTSFDLSTVWVIGRALPETLAATREPGALETAVSKASVPTFQSEASKMPASLKVGLAGASGKTTIISTYPALFLTVPNFQVTRLPGLTVMSHGMPKHLAEPGTSVAF